jgi:hypothetical protein
MCHLPLNCLRKYNKKNSFCPALVYASAVLAHEIYFIKGQKERRKYKNGIKKVNFGHMALNKVAEFIIMLCKKGVHYMQRIIHKVLHYEKMVTGTIALSRLK